MSEAEVREKIKKILHGHKLTVIATVDSEGNKPESAVIAFAEKDDLSLIFGTSNSSRKYRNLQNNKNVSFVIGWSSETGSVQYEGIAKELSNEEAAQHGELMALKNKQSEKFIVRESQRYFLVKPTWVRLVDTSPETNGNYELENFTIKTT